MSWYLKGQSNYDSSTGFHMGFYMDMNGFASGLYDSREMPSHTENGDPFMTFAVKTKTWTPASQQVEFGLWDHNRVRIDSSGIWGWHESSGVWFSLYSGSGVVGGAQQLSDLDDVGSVSYTSGFVLRADGNDYNSEKLPHNDLTGVTSSQHHTKYTDAEAISAVEGEATLELGAQVKIDNCGWIEGGSSPAGTTAMEYNGYFYATRVYNAVYNDYADYWKVAPKTPKLAGYCYSLDKKGLKITSKRADKACMGICSDTYGMAVGQQYKGIPISIGGFLLAHVDDEYEPGDLLTPNEKGCLTKATKEEILLQRAIAKYMFKETKIKTRGVWVNNRHWVKVI